VVYEKFEGVVDGRQRDARIGLADGLVEFLGGGVGLRIAKSFIDQNTRAGTADRTVGEN